MAGLALVVIGCFVVLRPFVSSLLWAAILCFSTWPVYLWFEKKLNGRRTLAAAIMTLLITLVLVVPFIVAGATLAENLSRLMDTVRRIKEGDLPSPPEWMDNLPLVGPALEAFWDSLTVSTDQVTLFLKAHIKEWLLNYGGHIGRGVLQLSLSVFISFFFYRDGEYMARSFASGFRRIAGEHTQHLLAVVGGTVKGVVYGLIGTSVAQGVLAGLGFKLAGVPSAFLLGLLTFFLSFIPGGAPLVWIAVTVWLFYSGATGWGVFMAVWGATCLFIVDNVLRSYLISRDARLPFVLVFLGIIGGILAFGFIGLFIGPTLLAAGYSLAREFISGGKGGKAPEGEKA
jgi:predicted PurR-regulated permease PerM